MITRKEFELAGSELKKNLFLGLPKMIEYKKSIQKEVLNIATRQELEDVALCRINQGMITKLARLAHNMWRSDGDAISLFCAAMAVGTIIKEYDWGVHYIGPDGLYELAERIQNA